MLGEFPFINFVMKRNLTLLLSIAAIAGIAFVALVSRQSNSPTQTSNQSAGAATQSQKQASSAKLDADAANKKAIADATASISRPAPAEPADVEHVLNRKLAQSGEKMDIKIKRTDGREIKPIVNEAGETERVQMDPSETVTVSLNYPEGLPGQKVIVAPYDGGKVNGKAATALQIPLDENRNLNFEFTADENLGRYQVSLDKGGDSKNFRTWVGPKPRLAGQ